MNERENWLRAVEFRTPAWIPCRLAISPLNWKTHRRSLEEIVLSHPRIFPGFKAGSIDYDYMPPVYRQNEYFRDHWGCLWHNQQEGLEGQVIEHPLADWRELASYQMPDVDSLTERGTRDWAKTRLEIAERKAKGQLAQGDGERLFDRLYFLRGFANLMFDFAEEPPELGQLIEMLKAHEQKLVQRWLDIGVDCIGFHTDLATQRGTMISPKSFRKHIKPLFRALFQTIRKTGTHVLLSSDGHVLEIVDDLIECGVSVHDPQLRANTLSGIARAYKGRLCAEVDLDRQGFPFMTPIEIRKQIKDVVQVMGDPQGGLMLLAAIYDHNTPLDNIKAICEAMEDTCFS